jgi:hypothetical protein
MTDEEACQFVKGVIAGSITLREQSSKVLSGEVNPEWFCAYSNGWKVKMHTGPTRETISGVKLVDKEGERSFFNLGAAQGLTGGVGPSRAIKNFCYAFAGWTEGLTWTEARDFLARILANSLAMTPNPRRS